MITTDWIMAESKDGLKKESWQFSYSPQNYRLYLNTYYQFERPNLESDFQIKRYWAASTRWIQQDRELSAMRLLELERKLVPMPSGIFALAQESALRQLKVDKLELPQIVREIAINEFKKHIRYSNQNAAARW